MCKNLLVTLGLLVSLGGCANLKPASTDWNQLAEQQQSSVPQWQQLNVAQTQNPLYLNELIQAPGLDELLQEAFTNNPNLQTVWLTLKIRQAELAQTKGERLPTVDASFSGSKDEDADPIYTGALTISWELDLWNRLGNQQAAAQFDLAEQQRLFQSSRDSLAAEVMQLWLTLISNQHSIAIQQRRLQSLQQNEDSIMRRYRSGLVSADDLSSARTSIASTRATLIELEENQRQSQRSLNTLLGRTDLQHLIPPANDYPATSLTWADTQVSLQRRPDLQGAFMAIQAADRRSAAAYKDLLPSLSLQAAWSDIADSPRDALFTNPLWSLLGQLSAPLYQGGQLKAAAQVAELNTAVAYQAYRDTLLTAVSEVENALGNERRYAAQQLQIASALENARNNLQQFEAKYRQGLVSILDLLAVQQTSFDLEEQMDQLIFQRLSNRLTLGLALGLGVNTNYQDNADESEPNPESATNSLPGLSDE